MYIMLHALSSSWPLIVKKYFSSSLYVSCNCCFRYFIYRGFVSIFQKKRRGKSKSRERHMQTLNLTFAPSSLQSKQKSSKRLLHAFIRARVFVFWFHWEKIDELVCLWISYIYTKFTVRFNTFAMVFLCATPLPYVDVRISLFFWSSNEFQHKHIDCCRKQWRKKEQLLKFIQMFCKCLHLY